MRTRKRLTVVLSLFLVVAAFLSIPLSPQFLSSAFARTLATSPVLTGAESYLILAGSTVTNTGPTVVSGDVGVSPGSAVVGFPPGVVVPPGTIHVTDGPAAAAQADNTVAFGTLDQTCDVTYGGNQDLTAVSPLGPGVYCATAFSLSGNLTLIGAGVWIFKSASTLITSPNSSVTGGDPCNVWWRVGSSATLDTSTDFRGSILALTSISLNTGASLNGRALARTGAVTLDDNDVSLVCAAIPEATSTPTSTPVGTPPAATPTGTPPAATPTSTPLPSADEHTDEPAPLFSLYLPAIR